MDIYGIASGANLAGAPAWRGRGVEVTGSGGSRRVDEAIADGRVDEYLGWGAYRVASVAVVSVEGMLGFGYSTAVADSIRAAGANDLVDRVVIGINSPGGQMRDLAELVSAVADVSDVKPVHAIARPMASSLAVVLLAAATEASVTPSGEVGALGVIAVVRDDSARAERQGVRVHVVTDQPLKTLGEPGVPVTDEHLAELERTTSRYADDMFRVVAAGRGVDESKLRSQGGRSYVGRDAVAAGLVDRVETFSELLPRVTSPNGKV